MAESERFTIVIPAVPRSLNETSGRGHRWLFTNEKKRWEGFLMIALLKEKVPKKLTVVEASAALRFPTKRRRDEGNYRSILEKALGDILQKGGWLADDTPEHYRFTELNFDPDEGPHATAVRLDVER